MKKWIDQARRYQTARFAVMSQTQKKIYTSAVYTVAVFVFLALFIPYARLWYYWFEVALVLHFAAAVSTISYFMRPSAPHWVPAVEPPRDHMCRCVAMPLGEDKTRKPRKLTKGEFVRISDAASNWAHCMSTEQRERYLREFVGVVHTVINNPEPQPKTEDRQVQE